MAIDGTFVLRQPRVCGATTVGNVALDGAPIGRQALFSGVGIRGTTATSFIFNVEPGTHTISLFASANGGAGSLVLDHSGYTYIVMAR